MSVLKYYNGSSWVPVIVGGPGPTGSQGATGPTGPTGPSVNTYDTLVTLSGSSATASLWSDLATGSISIGQGLTTGALNIATIGTGITPITIGHTNATITLPSLATAGFLKTSATGLLSVDTTSYASTASPTIITPTINTINVSASNTAATLWNTTLTTGSISTGGSLTTGGVNIATGSAFNGTVAIATGAGTVNKTINIGTASTSGTTAVTIGSSSGATSTVTLNGTVSTSGALTVGGDLTVSGTTTTINSTVVNVDDILIELGAVASPTNTTAEGGGISLLGTTNKTITWSTTGANWTSSENWNLVTGKTFKINNSDVLSSTAVLGITPTTNATGFTLSGGTTAVATTFAGGSAYTISGTNGTTITLPATTGTLPLNNQAFFIGTQSIAINQGTGTVTTLPGVSSINGSTIPASVTLAANVTTTIGDLIYASVTGTPGTLSRLAGNITTTRKFLRQTGDATNSTAPVWDTLLDADIPSALTGKSYNGLTLTSTTGTFTLAAAKTLSVSNTITLTGTDGVSINLGATNGTLGSAAFTASSAYEPAITTLAISKGGTGTGTAPTQYGLIYATSTTAYASTAAGASTQVLIGNAAGAPTWTNISGLSVSSASTATTTTNLSGTTQYSIPYQSASATTGYVSIGTAGQVLAVNGTTNGYTWISPFTNPMTTAGDIIYGGASGTPTRLAGSGTNNFVLTYNTATNAPVWAAASAASNASPTFTGTVTLPTSTTTVAPLVLPAGSLLTTPTAGVIESDGTTPYITESVTIGRSLIDTSHFATNGPFNAPLLNSTAIQPLWGAFVSATGTIGTPSGTGPWTTTITLMSATGGFAPGKRIVATAGTGSFNTNTVTIVSVDSATQITVSSTGGTIPTAGTVTNVTLQTTGALTLAANTTYVFEEILYTNTGATSHTTSLGFGGTVGVSSILFSVDSGLVGTPGTIQSSGTSGLSNVTFNTLVGGVIEAATTAAQNIWRMKGIIRTTTAGTIIPQLTFSAAPGGAPNSLAPGSYFRITPIGSSTLYNLGAWA